MNASLVIGGAKFKPGFEFRYYTRKELEQSPSKADGLDDEKIGFFRRQMGSFLSRMSTELKLNIWVIQTAAVYCERFFAKRSFAKNDRFLIVAAALFLASKAMDGPRPVMHVAHAYFKVKNANKPEELAALARDPQKKLKEQDVVESIILAERAILYTLAFQIKIELPQTCLFKNLEAVGVYTFSSVKGPTPESSLPTEQQQKLSQIAVNFANDSFKTNLPLQYSVEKLAAACLYHSARLNKIDLAKDTRIPGDQNFHDAFKITQAELDDIYDQLHHTFYAPKPDAAKKTAAAAQAHQSAAQQSAHAPPVATADATKHPQQLGSQAAPIVLKPPTQSLQLQQPASAHHRQAPSATACKPQEPEEEGELPEQAAPPAVAQAQGGPTAQGVAPAAHRSGPHRQAGPGHATGLGADGAALQRAPAGAGLQGTTAHLPHQLEGTGRVVGGLPASLPHAQGQHEEGSRKAARLGEQQQAPQGAADARQQYPSQAQQHLQQIRPHGGPQAQLPPQQHQLHRGAQPPAGSVGPAQPQPSAAPGQWGGENSRKRKAEELGETMPQGLVS